MNDDDSLKVAIIGAGQIAGGYDENRSLEDGGTYTHACAYTNNPHFDLACIFDLNYQKALRFQDYWHVKHCALSIREIYDTPYDVVSVCTPDVTHFEIIKSLLSNRCCKVIYAEKPLAEIPGQISEITSLSKETGIHVVVNFQRRFDSLYSQLRSLVQKDNCQLLTMNALYMKGLDHSGIAMIDMITNICGYPNKILTFNRSYNKEINEYSYDFILYYDNFNVTVKSIDSDIHGYTYHIFELDMLLSDRRIILNDNSRQCEVKEISNYAYSGVKILNDNNPVKTETGYKQSIWQATEYINNIICNNTAHVINTPQQSYNDALIAAAIKESYAKREEMVTGPNIWQ